MNLPPLIPALLLAGFAVLILGLMLWAVCKAAARGDEKTERALHDANN